TTRTTRTNRATATRNGAYVPPQTSRTPVTPGTYVFTGPVTRASGFDDRSITVNHNGILRPAFVPDTAEVTRDGARISVHDLREGETVRVTAKQLAPNEWRVLRINVVEPIVTTARVRQPAERIVEETYREERVARRDRLGAADRDPLLDRFDREAPTLVDYTGVGVVESVDRDEELFKVRVGNNTRTVYAMEAQISGVSRVRDLRKGDRVRVQGDVFGRDIFATRVTMLD
ncbi:MAG: hypothetical protein KY468_07490, partial [Armatimonadetes bacterium]|nr:hypothetical protein [Armatimonadota bacterium]